jgi:hypothetical protein
MFAMRDNSATPSRIKRKLAAMACSVPECPLFRAHWEERFAITSTKRRYGMLSILAEGGQMSVIPIGH